MQKTVRGRFAPSPSGRMHLGNLFSGLLAWLSVRSAGGMMVLRMEDLDPDRCKEAYAAQLADDLLWLGLDWDEGYGKGGPHGRSRQRERTDCFTDGVQGYFEENLLRDCGDFILRRSDGVYAYQLAVVYDDGAMAVNQVVRGQDLLDSTPRQLYL